MKPRTFNQEHTMKRLGYIGIILSYVILAYTAIFLIRLPQDSNNLLHCILIGVGVALLLVSIGLVGTKKRNEVIIGGQDKHKIDTWLAAIALFPLAVVAFVLLLPVILIFVLVEAIRGNFRRLTRPLRKIGFVMTKQKQGKDKVFLFSKGDLVIKIIRYKSFKISFDGGVSFCHVTDADIGTKEERQAIVNAMVVFDKCDYRDKDAYDPTRAIVDFLVKYLA